MPVLSVEGIGQISFPAPTSQERDLINAAAVRAPYGRGDQTLMDESVREVWQIPPEKISFEGKGGDLLVRHAGREAVVDLRGTDPGEVGFAAFYANCEHEVCPVVLGHRVCLIFNLVLVSRQSDGDPQPPVNARSSKRQRRPSGLGLPAPTTVRKKWLGCSITDTRLRAWRSRV